MDNELKQMKEIPENSRNAEKRIPHDPVRAQARELQVAGGSSSIRKDTGLRSLIQMPDEQSSLVVHRPRNVSLNADWYERLCETLPIILCKRPKGAGNKYIASRYYFRAESSSRRQGKYLARADHIRRDLPLIMPEAERHLKDDIKKEWIEQIRENSERLKSHQIELKNFKFGGRFETVKDNLTKAFKDVRLWHKQIAVQWLREHQVLVRLGKISNDYRQTTEQRQFLKVFDCYCKEREAPFNKDWGEVIKEWAEHWKQITGRPIDVVSDLEEIHDTVLRGAFLDDEFLDEEAKHDRRAAYICLNTYDILKRLMPDEAEISRLFHLEIEKAQQAIAEELRLPGESSDLLRSENIRPFRSSHRPQAKIFRGW